MTDKTQAALKLALDYLEPLARQWGIESKAQGVCIAIRLALADHIRDATKMIEPAQQQEPAVRWVCKGCGYEYMEAPSSCDCMECTEYDRIEYYTSPQPSKPWVGLTQKEIQELKEEGIFLANCEAIAEVIEAALKAKNT